MPTLSKFDTAIEAESGSGRDFKFGWVWFAPPLKISFNCGADNQMANEPFSRGLRGRELEFSGCKLPKSQEDRKTLGLICGPVKHAVWFERAELVDTTKPTTVRQSV